jgi:drug/metabolite transporter (DMT)-like permease
MAAPRLGTVLLALLAVAAFAGNSLLARAALGEGLIGAGSFTAIRLAAGAAALLPFLLRGPLAGAFSWRGALALFVYCAGFSFAYLELGAATGAMVLFAAVQATVVASGLLSGQKLRTGDIAGIALALGGVALLLGTRLAPGPLLAMTSMIAAGIAWGLYSVLGRSAADPARRTAANFVLAALLAAPLPLLDGAIGVQMPGAVLAVIAGALTSGLGYVAWYRLVPRLPHAAVGAVQLATPVVAALAAAVLLAEPLTPRLAGAAALIIGGIALTFRRG